MRRYENQRSYNDLGDTNNGNFNDMEGFNGTSPQNAPYSTRNTGLSSLNVSASSSKTVLAALRALQDKIRRLESERAQALDEAAQLRRQLTRFENDMENSRQKETLQAQKNLQEARQAQDALKAEKDELESRILQMEERTRNSKEDLDDLMKQIRKLELERNLGEVKIRDMDLQLQKLEMELHNAQQHEKELAQAILVEKRHHEDELYKLGVKLHNLHKELSEVTSIRIENETKLVELDNLVTQLLSVNESLVLQLAAGGNSASTSNPSNSKKAIMTSSKKKKVTSSKSRSKSVQRGGGASTGESSAKLSLKDITSSSDPYSVEAEGLLRLHKMYADLAHKITHKSINHETTKDDDKDDLLPTSTSTREIYTTKLDRPTNDSYTHLSSDTRIRTSRSQQIADKDKSYDMNHFHRTSNTSNNKYDIPNNTQPSRPSTSSSSLNYTPTYSLHNTFPSKYSSPPTSPSRNPRSSNELQSLISSLEEEFDTLNDQYHRLLNAVKSNSSGERSSGDSSSSQDESKYAEELVNVIKKLHKKGEQLRSLKSPIKSSLKI